MCPRCRTDLHIERKPAGIFWSCPQCTGLALNLAVLRRCLPPDNVQKFWRRLQTGSQTSSPCPSCAQSLQGFTHSAGQKTLALDVCKTCQIVWFDRGEFDALPEKPLPIETLSPETQEKLALLEMEYATELNAQLSRESQRIRDWSDMAITIVHLLIRLALRV